MKDADLDKFNDGLQGVLDAFFERCGAMNVREGALQTGQCSSTTSSAAAAGQPCSPRHVGGEPAPPGAGQGAVGLPTAALAAAPLHSPAVDAPPLSPRPLLLYQHPMRSASTTQTSRPAGAARTALTAR